MWLRGQRQEQIRQWLRRGVVDISRALLPRSNNRLSSSFLEGFAESAPNQSSLLRTGKSIASHACGTATKPGTRLLATQAVSSVEESNEEGSPTIHTSLPTESPTAFFDHLPDQQVLSASDLAPPGTTKEYYSFEEAVSRFPLVERKDIPTWVPSHIGPETLIGYCKNLFRRRLQSPYTFTTQTRSHVDKTEVELSLIHGDNVIACAHGRDDNRTLAEESAWRTLTFGLNETGVLWKVLSGCATASIKSPIQHRHAFLTELEQKIFSVFRGDARAFPILRITELDQTGSPGADGLCAEVTIELAEPQILITEQLHSGQSIEDVLWAAATRFRERLQDFSLGAAENLAGDPGPESNEIMTQLRKHAHSAGLSDATEVISTKQTGLRWPDGTPVEIYEAHIMCGGVQLGDAAMWVGSQDVARRPVVRRLANYSAMSALRKFISEQPHNRQTNERSAKKMSYKPAASQSVRSTVSGTATANTEPRPSNFLKLSRPVSTLVSQELLSAGVRAIRSARKQGLPDTTVAAAAETDSGKFFTSLRRLPRVDDNISRERRQDYYAAIQTSPLRSRLEMRAKLPVMLPETRHQILSLVEDNDVVIVVAETGSGKSTQIPQIILDDAICNGKAAMCRVACTQPRRISATSVAYRVAWERNEPLGLSIGYKVRFANHEPALHVGNILYCTTGVLLTSLQTGPDHYLEYYSHIIIDEVHVRDMPIDLLLAAIRVAVRHRRANGRVVPKIILMSATINIDLFHNYFSKVLPDEEPLKVGTISVPGQTFKVEDHFLADYLPDLHSRYGHHPDFSSFVSGNEESRQYLEAESVLAVGQRKELEGRRLSLEDTDHMEEKDSAVGKAVISEERDVDLAAGLTPAGLIVTIIAHIVDSTANGAILVFLPGIADIEKIAEMLTAKRIYGIDFTSPKDFKIYKLHSRLRETNDDVFESLSPSCRKIILATNIAETSITIADVKFVVDSGTSHIVDYDHVTCATDLASAWISRADSTQRRGRAGRVGDGHYYAVFSNARFQSLRPVTPAELTRSDLTKACLDIRTQVFNRPIQEYLSEVIEPPPPTAVEAAVRNLKFLGALTPADEVTPFGRFLSQIRLDPFQAKLVLLGVLFRCLEPVLILVSYSADASLVRGSAESVMERKIIQEYSAGSGSDLTSIVNIFRDIDNATTENDHKGIEYLTGQKNLQYRNYLEMKARMRLVSRDLVETGLVQTRSFLEPLDMKRWDLNMNSDNAALINALVLITSNSRLAQRMKWKNTWRTEHDPKAIISSVSVNRPARATEVDDLVAFQTKRTSNGMAVIGPTWTVTPLMALLCGGPMHFLDGMVTINDGLRFEVQLDTKIQQASLATQAGKIVVEFRKALDRFLTVALSGLKNVRLGQGSIGSDLTPAKLNPLFAEESMLRDTMVNGLAEVLKIDAAAWESVLEARREEAAAAETGEEVQVHKAASEPAGAVDTGDELSIRQNVPLPTDLRGTESEIRSRRVASGPADPSIRRLVTRSDVERKGPDLTKASIKIGRIR